MKKKNVFVIVIVVVIVFVIVIVIDIRPSFTTRHMIYQSRGLSQTITVLISARLTQQNAAMCTRTHFKTQSVSLLSWVPSRRVRPFFVCTRSQESKSEVG